MSKLTLDETEIRKLPLEERISKLEEIFKINAIGRVVMVIAISCAIGISVAGYLGLYQI